MFSSSDSDTTVCDHERQSEDRGSRKCSKRCNSDLDCNSSRKKCMCDGKCGKSCVNPNLRCYPIPTNIPNGRVDIKPYNKFEAIATYTCNEGYVIVGLPARVCQGDETWMGEEPRCELKTDPSDGNQECRTPPSVHHATHNGPPGQTRFKLGANIQYTCLPGFTQLKDSVERAWCVGAGVWVGPNITCTTSGCATPSEIDNGYFDLLGPSTVGSKMRYHCNKGYFLVGNAERTCLRDGTWDGRSPSCEQVVCGPPPHVEHAEHDAPKDQFRFLTGTHLMYTCQFGYYREGSERAICSGAEGQWIGPTMTCKARDCGAPGEINNGYRDTGYRFTYPTRVTYHCNEGFEMTGRPYRECQANGEWSGTLPECVPVHCSELIPPVYGTMIGSSTSFNSVIRFVCNNGYKVVGSQERTCQADRTWSGQESTCVEINCGIPGPIFNGYLDGHRTTVGALYFYRCNTRTKFSGEHFSTQCMENGQWSNPPPLCLGQCQIPYIMNGTITNAREEIWVDPGTVIEPRCLNGLVLNDSRPVTCVNGTWNVIPRCVPAPCDQPPPQVENGHRTFFDLSHGSKARYFCMAGFKLVDNNRYMSCEYGQWTGIKPACEESYCPNPGTLLDGNIYKVGSLGKFLFNDYIVTIKHGERLIYECKRNFKLEGPRGAACVNGKWSPGEKPRCLRSRHTLFNKIWKPYEENPKGKMYY
ncbi:protein lev-9 [Biomphalaria pfeifferi]|uniref:Protein lev-9 n=1 Tax=Biomphalaria pfeifferi TaxID=112525 RepID=A0AAD8C2X6_BIOPF|nr:protein lev-9 [Biomphalaria pfeifferi]